MPADAALVEPRHVGHQRVFALRPAAREAFDAQLVILAELLGQVVVAVDQRRFLEDAVDARLDLGIDRLGQAGVATSGTAAAEIARVTKPWANVYEVACRAQSAGLVLIALASMKR